MMMMHVSTFCGRSLVGYTVLVSHMGGQRWWASALQTARL